MFDRVTDMPPILRAGLSPDQQEIVRGIVNSSVYDEKMEGSLAVSKAQRAIVSAGYVWSNTRYEPITKKVRADAVIAKSVDDNRLVFGWANIIKTDDGKVLVDRENDFIDDDWELEKAAYDYMLDYRDGGVMHARTGVATTIESMMFTDEKFEAMGIAKGILPVGWWLGMKVHDDEVWKGVKEGKFKGFSVHGKGIRKATPISPDTHSNKGA